MNDKTSQKEETNTENSLFEVILEESEEITKERFFKILASKEEGLTLTISRLGVTFTSKWKNDKGETPSGFFIDYTFTIDDKDYQVGINYNVGVPVDDETFILTSGMNIFKILAVAIDLSTAKQIKVSKNFLTDTLEGLTFQGELGQGFNSFIIKPIKKIE